MKKMTTTFVISLAIFFANSSNAQWQLTGNSNATATSVLGTTNAIPLSLVTKNTKRLVIDTLGRVGIGTATPVNILTVKGAGSTPVASWVSAGAPLFVGFGETTIGNADFILNMGAAAANARPVFVGRKSRGTLAAPAAVSNNDYLMSFLASGYDGSAFQNPAAIDFYVDGTPSVGNVPGRVSFVTGTNSSNRKERMKIRYNGDIVINDSQLVVTNVNGNVGIGTMSPNFKLQVNGDALINNIKIGKGKGGLLTNTALGDSVLSAVTTGDWNSAVGYQALKSNTSGIDNTAVGLQALWSNTEGSENTAVGINTLNFNTTGYYNTAVGVASMYKNTTGYNNTAIGGWSLGYNTTGSNNTANGYLALNKNTQGNQNTASGVKALYSNTTGNDNTAIGHYSLISNTTGSENTATGQGALSYNTTGYSNTATGQAALYNNTTGQNNTAHGQAALVLNTTGKYNTANGGNSLFFNTTGEGNTALGYEALYNGATESNNTAIGYESDIVVGNNIHNSTALGSLTIVDASNKVRIGNDFITSIGGQVGWTSFSDGRIKQDIKENVTGLAFINLLKPVTYHFNLAKQYELMGRKDTMQWQGKNDIEKINFTSFIAQDVEAAAKKIEYDFSGVDKRGKIMGLRYAEFVVPLVKAVQELSKTNDELKKQNATLESRLAKLEAIMNVNPPVTNRK